MMEKAKQKKGFTLVELIVAIVVSGIVLTLSSYIFITFINTSRKIQATEARTAEQNIIVKYLESLANKANLKGKRIIINYENNYLYLEPDVDEEISYSIIEIDNENKKMKYDEVIIKYNKIARIDFINIETSNKQFLVEITYDDDSIYQFYIYIVGGIAEE